MLSRSVSIVIALTSLSALPFALQGQINASTSAPILQQTANAFSPNNAITHLTLNGTVTWYTGSTTDTGTVVLSGAADGSGTLALTMQNRGAYSEVIEPVAANRGCDWTDATGSSHAMHSTACTIPFFSLIPGLALQPSTSFLSVTDQGIGTLQFVQARILTVNSAIQINHSMSSTTNGGIQIGLDPVTLLPSVVEYHIRGESNPMADIKVDISFANYVLQNGVEIPQSIQRRLNGSLNLDIKIQSSSLQ